MRKNIAAILVALAILSFYAEYRGVDPIDVPGKVVVDVGPAPGVVIPGSGIRVLFVRPGDPKDVLPADRDYLPDLGIVRDWIKANATFRNWDEATDISKAPEDFKKMMNSLSRSSSRWLVVANGPKVRYSGPWPATGDEAVKLLESCK